MGKANGFLGEEGVFGPMLRRKLPPQVLKTRAPKPES